MPGTYAQILFHAVFSTKHRHAFITPEIQPRLYAYIGGIVRAEKGTLYAIGGMPDHATTVDSIVPSCLPVTVVRCSTTLSYRPRRVS